MFTCITLKESNVVLVKNKDDEMKIEEELQVEWLDDRWEEADRRADGGWEKLEEWVHF